MENQNFRELIKANTFFVDDFVCLKSVSLIVWRVVDVYLKEGQWRCDLWAEFDFYDPPSHIRRYKRDLANVADNRLVAWLPPEEE